MLKLFKNKSKDDQRPSATFFEKVNRQFIQYELKLADLIDRRTRHWSIRQWKHFLIVFCTVGGTAATYEMVTSVARTQQTHSTEYLTIVSPEYAIHPGGKERSERALISETEYSRLAEFENYLDSMKNSQGGRPYYDSLMSARSGLMDTIRMIKQLYLLQRSR